jgi:ABC-type multidrug transport system fused ATPase/permease subunit
MNFPAALQNGLAAVIAFVPLALLFLLILVVGLIVAKLIEKGLSRLLTKVGFDRAVERGGIKKALANSKLDASDIVSKIIYYTLVLFVLQFAFGVFGQNPVSDLLAAIINFLPKIIVAIIIIVIAAAIAAGVKGLIQNTLGGLSYGKVLANVAAVFILFLGATAALNQVGIATTVTTPILIAVLAIIAGVIIVGAGGGLIKPMQQRWEAMLSKAESEAPKIQQHAQNAPSVAEQAKQAAATAKQAGQSSTSSATRAR